MRMIAMWLAAAIMLVAAAPSMGTIYYVRKSGSNGNTGRTVGAAWLTIDKAANTMVAGDIVYVGAGTYVETITPNNDGTAALHVKYFADTAGAYTGDAGAVIIKAPSGSRAISVSGDDYQEYVGFEIQGSSSRDAVRWSTSKGGILQNCNITTSPVNGVLVNSTSSLSLINCQVYNCVADCVQVSGGTLTITGCTLRNAGDDGIDIYAGATVTVSNTFIHSCTDAAVGIGSATPTVNISRCTIYSCKDGIWAGFTSNLTVTNVLFYSLREECIEIENNSTAAAIWHCTMYGSRNGVVVKGGTETIKNCIIQGNSQYGMSRTGGTVTHTHNIMHANTLGNLSGLSMSTGELAGDAKFVAAGTDFSLQGTSPAINSATNASAVTTADRGSATRPYGGGWDMGCMEYTGGVVATRPKIVQWTNVSPE